MSASRRSRVQGGKRKGNSNILASTLRPRVAQLVHRPVAGLAGLLDLGGQRLAGLREADGDLAQLVGPREELLLEDAPRLGDRLADRGQVVGVDPPAGVEQEDL